MKKNNKKAFTIIEVIIGIFIFSLGLVSVFMLFAQSSKMTVKSKNTIIATNLARESIELLKNVRDTNFKTHRKFDWIPNENPNAFSGGIISNYFHSGGTKYAIEIDFSKKYGIDINELSGSGQLYLSGGTQYTYGSGGTNKKTDFYRYLKFEDAKYDDGGIKKIPSTYKVTSVVKWKKAGGGKIEIPFILADWKKL